MNKEKVLIVDDEEHIVELLKFNLENAGYNTVIAFNGVDAVKIAAEEEPDLMLLDVMLPGMDGLEVCKTIKGNKQLRDISIIMLTAKSEELDKILGLELGADDYITKPFSIRELLARVKAVLRRNRIVEVAEENVQDFGRLKVDFDRHEIFIENEKINMTLKEFELLETLIKNKGKILKREVLLDKVWGYEYIGETRTVDVHVRRLRSKLDSKGKLSIIETVFGIGYVMR